jgi:hypothetical protein
MGPFGVDGGRTFYNEQKLWGGLDSRESKKGVGNFIFLWRVKSLYHNGFIRKAFCKKFVPQKGYFYNLIT